MFQKKHIPSSNLVLFASEDAHYSTLKWGNVCDVEVALVKTDEYGRMDVNDLRDNILQEQRKGNYPFSVTATAGFLSNYTNVKTQMRTILITNDYVRFQGQRF